MQKVGIGYDIHRLAEGRKLVLGGVEIPYNKGLEGHSDADVLLHAVCDALLGAIGQGDIGEHFPNTDPKYKDISSLKLLDETKSLVESAGYRINNVDTVIIAEEPNLKEYKSDMKTQIAKHLGLDDLSVNIKATTQERLGSLGRGEGIAAFATAMLTKEE